MDTCASTKNVPPIEREMMTGWGEKYLGDMDMDRLLTSSELLGKMRSLSRGKVCLLMLLTTKCQ